VVFVALIVLEGRRQSRKLGHSASGRPNALGNALLEVQGMLEADRKVEILQEEVQHVEHIDSDHEQYAGDLPDEPREPAATE